MNDKERQVDIVEVDFDDGDKAVVVELPAAPYGKAIIVAPDESEDSIALLDDLITNWLKLWPAMLQMLQDGIRDYEAAATKLEVDDIVGSVQRTEEGYYMSDRADIFLRLEFDEAPVWDYFIRGSEIVHFQPVF